MKKVLASLLVLASLASVSGIVSFADNTWDESNYWNENNYWHHAVSTILNPGQIECANFDECLKRTAEGTKRLTDGEFDFDISPFLGSDSERVKEFNEVNSKWLDVLNISRFLVKGIRKGKLSLKSDKISEVLDQLSQEEYRLYYDRFNKFQKCTDDINHEKSMDLFRALWKVSCMSDEECII